MKVYRTLESFEKGTRPVATIGTFDGVHLGHRKILQRLMDESKALDGESVVISFHPHPRLVLFPDDNPLRMLQTIDEKIATLESLGIDKFMIIPFTREFSRYTSDMFIEEVLVKRIGIRHLIVGYDHHFGKNRTGGLKDLEAGGAKYGFGLSEIPAEAIDNANVSSTKIRTALGTGDVAMANRFLGYEYPVTGTVMKGQQLGRQLGYPTANIRPNDVLKMIPAEGVYLVRVKGNGVEGFGMLNIGKKPTVGEFPLGIEVNIFDFSGDLYDQTLTVNFIQRIRDDQKFDNLDSLVRAIDSDKEACLQLISAMK